MVLNNVTPINLKNLFLKVENLLKLEVESEGCPHSHLSPATGSHNTH